MAGGQGTAPTDPAGPPPGLSDVVDDCLCAVLDGLDRAVVVPPSPAALRICVQLLAAALAGAAPGHAVEVRVPPYVAIQCGAGPRHTRGTPPNVVECDPVSFVRLLCGRADWDSLVATGLVRASGERADLRPYLPLAVPGGPSGGRRGPTAEPAPGASSRVDFGAALPTDTA